nr:DNA mismatch repair protein MutS [Maliibacterium massiliense]
MANVTPMMQQYLLLKQQHPDCILFYRLGDFYEMFFDDAIEVSRVLELTLTGRDCGLEERAPMCGVPYHAAETYIRRLIEKGYKVAIAEQMVDPKLAKGLVDRDIIRIVTPGTVLEDAMLEGGRNNYLVSLALQEACVGLAYVDVSTGEFEVMQLSGEDWQDKLVDELVRIEPAEIIADEAMILAGQGMEDLKHKGIVKMSAYKAVPLEQARQTLLEHFHVQGLDVFEMAHLPMGIMAAGALMNYLAVTQKNAMAHITSMHVQRRSTYMVLDATTRYNLELTQTMRGKSKRGSLLGLLDRTQTSMGARMLRRWIEQPLLDAAAINARLDAVEAFASSLILRDTLRGLLHQVYDMERLASRVSVGSANARDLLSLAQSLGVLPGIKEALSGLCTPLVATLDGQIDQMQDLCALLTSAISPDAPLSVRDPGIIADGFDKELDELRDMALHSRDWIAALEREEREKTGIKNLKIGFNKVFGYYIEVTKSYFELVPIRYIRKQTLANCERYITPELKEMEEKLLGVEDKIAKLEYDLFCQVRLHAAQNMDRIQRSAQALAQLDVLQALAAVAMERQYVKPSVDTSDAIEITDGRHPVVEAMQSQQHFVPNDTKLDHTDNRFLIITGPNMAGKSTYMRQVALIALLAHIGSFVPARAAHIGVLDRIFTRVGASDDLSSGQSTFMVEMSEVSHILHNATPKSLLILDEIGRGTSTFDGLSIAWAVVEYILSQPRLGSKTLFATHYHELSELEGRLPGLKNYCVSVKEHGDDVIFLRRIIRGGADKSFGIQVARLAGLPQEVVSRAKEILGQLEAADISQQAGAIARRAEIAPAGSQVDLFAPPDAQEASVISRLRDMDVSTITPLEALNTLNELQQQLKK